MILYTPNEEGGDTIQESELSMSSQVDSLSAGLAQPHTIYGMDQQGSEFSIIQEDTDSVYGSGIEEAIARLYMGILARECIQHHPG